jgi:hypothetical protein
MLTGALIATDVTDACATAGMSQINMSSSDTPMTRLPLTIDIPISCPTNKICTTVYK